MARIFVTDCWDQERVDEIVQMLRSAGHHVATPMLQCRDEAAFWAQIDPSWKSWTSIEYSGVLGTNRSVHSFFVRDARAMEWADTCLTILPAGRAAHIALGIFAGAQKRRVLLTNGGEPELYHLFATDICAANSEVLDALGQ